MNQYSYYSYAAQDFQSACDDKILVDLAKLKNMKEFDEVDNFVTNNFGQIEDEKFLNYPNDVLVYVKRAENVIIVEALKEKEHIFGLQWTFTPSESK